MIDPIADAHANIQQLESLPVTLSAEMRHAIDLLRSAGVIDPPALPDWSQLKPEDVPARYREYLRGLNVHQIQKEQANQFLRSLAVWVNQRFLAERDRLVPEVQPLFDQAAARYVEAADVLPERLSNETLVKGGPKVLEAFEQAQTAAAEMSAYTDFVGRIDGEEGRVLVRCTPETADELRKLVSATRGKQDPAVVKVDPTLLAAAHHGVALELNPKAEQKRLLQTLRDSENQHAKRNHFTRNAFING